MTSNKNNRYIVTLLSAILLISLFSGSAVALDNSEFHDLNKFNVELEQAINNSESPSELQTESGFSSYNLTVNATVNRSTFGFVYPVEINFYEVEPSFSSISDLRNNPENYKRLDSNTIFLTPNGEDKFIPVYDKHKGYMINNSYQETLLFDDIESSSENKKVVVDARSRLTGNLSYDTNKSLVKGPTAAGYGGGVAEETKGYNDISSSEFVDAYKISESGDPGFNENRNMPSIDGESFSGNVKNFADMKARDGHAVLQSESGTFNMVTRNEITSESNSEESTPYTISITYNLVNTNKLDINVLNSDGEEVVKNTDYNLVSDPTTSEDCRNIGSDKNLCTFVLEQDETDMLNRLGELYLQYKIDGSGQASIGCQSVISGYQDPYSSTCGYGNSSSGAVLGIEWFEGQNSSGWYSPEISRDYGTMPDNLDMRLNVTTAVGGGNSDYDAHYIIVNREKHLGTLDFTGSVQKGTIDLDDPSTSKVSLSSPSKSFSDLPEIYSAYVCLSDRCSSPNDISRIKYDDSHDIIFNKGNIPKGFELVTSDPETIILENVARTDTFVNTYRSKETIDADYSDGRSDWDCLKGTGCGEPSSSPNFDGTIKESVIVRGVSDRSDIRDARVDGDMVAGAASKRSDISSYGGSWDRSNRDVELRRVGYDVEYHSNRLGIPGDGWASTGTDQSRRVQVGKNEKSEVIVDGASLRASTGGEKGWYPVRDPVQFDGSEVKPFSETIYRPSNYKQQYPSELGIDTEKKRTGGIDPDVCFNCYPTENVYNLAQRKGYVSSGSIEPEFWDEGIIGTPSGINIWELATDEQSERKRGDILNSISYQTSDSSGASTVFTDARDIDGNPVDSSDSDALEQNINRQIDSEYRPLNEYERSSGIRPAVFRSADVVEYKPYEREVYDIEYTFESNSIPNRELYLHQKEVTEETKTYEGKIGWIDVSESKEYSESIKQFSVKFNGASVQTTVSWNSSVHSINPEDMTPSNVGCSSGSFTQENKTSDSIRGDNGYVIIDKCDYNGDGDDENVRIGKKYRVTGTYAPEVTMLGSYGNSQSSPYEIRVRSRDSANPIRSQAEITDVTALNDRVDYRGGTIPIETTLKSDTEKLDRNYILTVSPADKIDESATCSDIVTSDNSYQKQVSTRLSSEYATGFSAVQSINCTNPAFEEPSEVEDEFLLSEVKFTEGSATAKVNYNDIPAGAIQKCRSPLSGTSSNCDAPEKDNIDFGSPGNWKPVEVTASGDGPLGTSTCPDGYNLDEKMANDGTNTRQNYCVINEEKNPASFNLKERTIDTRFNSVEDVFDLNSCSDIPITTEQEGETHDGYEQQKTGTKNGEDIYKCVKKTDTQPGPEEVPMDLFDDPSKNNPDDLPAGSFRGNSLISSDTTSFCNSDTTDNGVESDISGTIDLICTYDGGDEVKYGEMSVTEWSSTEDIVIQQTEYSDAPKKIFESRYLNADENDDTAPAEEKVMTLINPRRTGLSPGEVHEFTISLHKGTASSEPIQSETVNVELCEGQGISDVSELPKESIESTECTGFDNLLTGQPTLVNNQITVSDAVDNGGSGETVTTIKNDACPYNANFPRAEDQIKGNTFTISHNNKPAAREEIRKKSKAFYSLYGDPCSKNGSRTDRISVTAKKLNTLIFNSQSFAKNDKNNVEYARHATLGDLAKNNQAPSETLWSRDDLGGIRIGNPVTRDLDQEEYGLNKDLVAQYSFDSGLINAQEDPDFDYTYTRANENVLPGASSDVTLSPQFNQVQDVYVGNHDINGTKDLIPNNLRRDKTGTSFTNSRNAYNGRIWFGTPCNVESSGDSNMGIHDMRTIGTSACQGYGVMSHTEIQNVIKNKGYDQIWYRTGEIKGEAKLYKNQSAFLPTSPKQGEYTKNFADDIQPHPTKSNDGLIDDTTVKTSYANRFSSEGIFGGNSLSLDETSWFMMTPTCENIYSTGGNRIGDSNENPSDCDPTDFNNFGGGYDRTTLGGYSAGSVNGDRDNLHDKISDKDGRSYTVTFWMNPTENDEISYNSISKKPHNNIISSSLPSRYDGDGDGTESDVGTPPYITQSLSLSYSAIPESISYHSPENIIASESDDFNDRTELNKGYNWPVASSGSNGEFMFGGGINHETFDNGWVHIAIKYDDASEKITIFRNGEKVKELSGSDIKYDSSDDIVGSDQEQVTVGEIYNNGVLSIGGAFYESEFDNNPNLDANPTEISSDHSGPFISSSDGEILIDEVKIFNKDIPDSQIRDHIRTKTNALDHNLSMTNKPMYTGELTTNPISYSEEYRDENSENIVYVNDRNGGGSCSGPNCQQLSVDKNLASAAVLNVDVVASGEGTYDVEVIPCDSGSCDDSGDMTVSEIARGQEKLDGTSKSFNIGQKELGVNGIDRVKFDITVGSESLTNTPVIKEIKLQAREGYDSCLHIQEDNPGLKGMVFNTSIITQTGEFAEVQCDLRTANGGWTKFAWFEEGSEILNRNDDSGATNGKILDSNNGLEDCDIGNESCAARADFSLPLGDEIDPKDYNVDTLGELRPQILIKSKDSDGNTIDWAAFEINPTAHQNLSEVEYLDLSTGFYEKVMHGSDGPISWVSEEDSAIDYGDWDDRTLRKILMGRSQTVNHRRGIDETNARYIDSANSKPADCLYPYDSSSGYSGRCITHYEHRDEGGQPKFEIEQLSYDGSSWNPEFYNIRVKLNPDDPNKVRKVEDVKCLQEPSSSDEYKCEMYYSMGNAFNKSERYEKSTSNGEIVTDPMATESAIGDEIFNDQAMDTNDVEREYKNGIYGVEIRADNVAENAYINGASFRAGLERTDNKDRKVWVSIYKGGPNDKHLDTEVLTKTDYNGIQEVNFDSRVKIPTDGSLYTIVYGGSYKLEKSAKKGRTPYDPDVDIKPVMACTGTLGFCGLGARKNPVYDLNEAVVKPQDPALTNNDALNVTGVYEWEESDISYNSIRSKDISDGTDVLDELSTSEFNSFNYENGFFCPVLVTNCVSDNSPMDHYPAIGIDYSLEACKSSCP